LKSEPSAEVFRACRWKFSFAGSTIFRKSLQALFSFEFHRTLTDILSLPQQYLVSKPISELPLLDLYKRRRYMDFSVVPEFRGYPVRLLFQLL